MLITSLNMWVTRGRRNLLIWKHIRHSQGMLWQLVCSLCLRVYVLILDVWNRGALCLLQVHSSSFSYVAQGWLPKSKELLFLCRNVGTGQRSALPHSLCFSPHLSPSRFFFFWHLYFSSSFCLNRVSISTLSLLIVASSTMLFRLLTHPYFLPFHSSSFVSTCNLYSCTF